MTNVRSLLRSFAGGEISPLMFGRIDDVKYQTGVRQMRNWIASPQGPAQFRPGFAYVDEAKTGTPRLLSFRVSPTLTIGVQVGAGYFRFHSGGATVLAYTAWSDAVDYVVGNWVVDTDVLYECTADNTNVQPPDVLYWKSHEYVANRQTSAVDPALDTITFAVDHGLVTGDPIEFTDDTGTSTGTAPGGLSYRTIYYAIKVDDVTIQVASTAALAAVPTALPISSVGSSATDHRMHREYTSGDLVSYLGNVCVCIADRPIEVSGGAELSVPPSDTNYWHQLPDSGIYEIPNSYAAEDLPKIRRAQKNDVMTITCGNKPAAELRRYAATRWTFAAIDFTDRLNPPTGLANTIGVGVGTTAVSIDSVTNNSLPAVVRVVTPTQHQFAPGDALYVTGLETAGVADGIYACGSVAGVASPGTGTLNLSVAETLEVVTFEARYASYPGVGSTLTCSGSNPFVVGDSVRLNGSATPNNNCLWVIYSSGLDLQLTTVKGNAGSTVTFYTGVVFLRRTYDTDQLDQVAVRPASFSIPNDNTYVVTALDQYGIESAASAELDVLNNLAAPGANNTLSWAAVTGAQRYRVYKKQSGLLGYIGETEGLEFKDDNIAPDLGKTPPQVDTGLEGTDYPVAVTYFEGRRCFGGTPLHPQKLWMTRSTTETDLSYSLPVVDSDRISFEPSINEQCPIQHLVPLAHLIMLTVPAELRITPINSDAITPSSVSARAQSYVGSSEVTPLVVNNNLIFCAARGGHIREMGYSVEVDGFLTGDLSLRAAHFFDGYEIVDMSFMKAPLPIVWAVSSSGDLLGMTYVPEERVGAWHKHTTDGAFKSACLVQEGVEDRLYVVVERTINEQTVTTIERMEPIRFAADEDACCLDCSLTTSTADGTVSTHLLNTTVRVVADGVYLGEFTTDNAGEIDIGTAAGIVHVGLPYTGTLETLPFFMQTDGFGQGTQKNVNRVALNVYRAAAFKTGPDADNLVPTDAAQTGLVTGVVDVVTVGTWGDTGGLLVVQDEPLPVTIVSMTLQVAVGG